ncbi:MAG: HAD-IA family hydrolase [Gammaproteobacteria bacterium]|nr:HAD-IA family hydrolase [Gammaproteobacteria bacterium]
MYQLVIFDWDGTLMDSAHKIATCLQKAARDVDMQAPELQRAKSIIGLGLQEAMNILFPDATQEQVAALVEAYRHQFVIADETPQQLFEGVEAGLQELCEQGALLAVATGKARSGMNRVFKQLPLEQYFVATRCGDEARSKPHPQMLHDLLEYTAIDPQKAIMVGDTSFDMEMAGNANVSAVGAGYGVHSDDALRAAGAMDVLPSFMQLADWLLADRVSRAHV